MVQTNGRFETNGFQLITNVEVRFCLDWFFPTGDLRHRGVRRAEG